MMQFPFRHSEFVVYDKVQTYPEFLVKYRRIEPANIHIAEKQVDRPSEVPQSETLPAGESRPDELPW